MPSQTGGMKTVDLLQIEEGTPMTVDHECPEVASLHGGEGDNLLESPPRRQDPHDLVVAYRPLARRIARQIYDALPQGGIHEFDDLLQAGLVGLLTAARSYTPDRCVAFPVYARFRIRGEILDHLRRLDMAPRGLRQRQRRVAEAVLRLRVTIGREPTAEETAETLGMDIEESRELARDLHNVFRLTDDSGEIDSSEAPAWAAYRHNAARPDNLREQAQVRNLLRVAIDSLAPSEREVISLYYLEEKSMKEIGRRLGIHTSRVFQVRNRALEGMGDRLREQGVHSAIEMAPDNLAVA
jgi:RNA polymerase sigma factor for flagellar operon FliA